VHSSLFLAALTLLQIHGVNSERCVNSLDYFYDRDVTHTCNWIRDDEDRRQELCLEAEVASGCPISCGQCCQDDIYFVFNVGLGGEAGCDLIRLITNNVQRNKNCDKDGWLDQGWGPRWQLVKNGCPKACENCVSKVTNVPSTYHTVPPSELPSMEPTRATRSPTKKPVVVPTKKHEAKPTKRSVKPTKKPTISNTNRSPSKKPTVAPTNKQH